MKWIILCIKGGRISSVEYTEENLKYLQSQLYLMVTHVNYDGTTYFEVLGIK